jgi:hypothetical protein
LAGADERRRGKSRATISSWKYPATSYEHPETLKKNLKLLHFVVGDQDVLHEADKRTGGPADQGWDQAHFPAGAGHA